MKKLKRTVIIRDADLDRLLYKSVKSQLYDRYEIEPMTYRELQQENLILKLKNPEEDRIPAYRALPTVYEDMLYRERSLYDRRYLKWIFTLDYPDGQIYVQSNIRQVRQMLYRVTFERDYG